MPRLPREGERDTGKPGPTHACTRCGKLWYDYVMYVRSAEGKRFASLLPYYEGQRPPEPYKTWREMREAHERGIQQLLGRKWN